MMQFSSGDPACIGTWAWVYYIFLCCNVFIGVLISYFFLFGLGYYICTVVHLYLGSPKMSVYAEIKLLIPAARVSLFTGHLK